jgi:predicted nucleic acid-binding protein
MRIYCDTVILIYYYDLTGSFQTRAISRLRALRAAGDTIAVSDLTRLECRVKPMRNSNTTQLAIFDGFFAQPDIDLVPITTAVFDRATTLRAVYNFKLADALHLAAIESHCDRFLTNDLRLSACQDIVIEVLPP